jgi:carbonic anhydrase
MRTVLLLLCVAAPAAAQGSVCTRPNVPGREQSPVNIVSTHVAPQMQALVTHYPPVAGKVFNTGVKVQVNVAPGNAITVDGKRFELREFHFHWPGEHLLAGSGYPVEIHMVHEAADGRLAVVGTWVQEGAYNPSWNAIWSHLPGVGGDTVHVTVNIPQLFSFTNLNHETVYRYCGSLTSPPYGEGETWLMRRTPITMSRAQIAQLHQAMQRAYARAVQPLNHRQIRYRPH